MNAKDEQGFSPVVAIVQARTGSSRLPGKVFKDLAGKPMLARVLDRLARARTIDMIVVAVPDGAADDPLATLCRAQGWTLHRGSEHDVLDRFYHAARAEKARTIVRITSDCPLLSPTVVDRVVDEYKNARPRADYASNGLDHRTFPRGLDAEVFSSAALERAWNEDQNPAWREHVTPFIYRHPELFRCLPVQHSVDLSRHRWTVDTPQDLQLVRLVFDHFGHRPFEWEDVVGLLESHPDWSELNRGIQQKGVP